MIANKQVGKRVVCSYVFLVSRNPSDQPIGRDNEFLSKRDANQGPLHADCAEVYLSVVSIIT